MPRAARHGDRPDDAVLLQLWCGDEWGSQRWPTLSCTLLGWHNYAVTDHWDVHTATESTFAPLLLSVGNTRTYDDGSSLLV